MSVEALNQFKPVNTITQADRASMDNVFQNVKNEAPKDVIKDTQKDTRKDPFKVTREDAESLAEVMNKVSELFNRQLHFEVFEETDRLYVQIIDKETKEVIKQIPPKEMLELSARIQEMVGLLLDKYA